MKLNANFPTENYRWIYTSKQAQRLLTFNLHEMLHSEVLVNERISSDIST